jgi:hypothetical protein
VDGTGLTRLTFNSEEERAPAWSPDGTPKPGLNLFANWGELRVHVKE